MPFCVLCSAYSRDMLPDDFCRTCRAGLRKEELAGEFNLAKFAVPAKPYEIYSAYAYRGLARSCILAYKAQGHRLVGEALVRSLMEHPSLLNLLLGCDAVMPAPSSLWSRLNGRLDLAYLLADSLSRRVSCALVLPPRALSWRWTKQTWLLRRQRRRVLGPPGACYDADFFKTRIKTQREKSRIRVLILDDVVTTANTLTDLADRFRNVDLLFFTLASAFRPNGTASHRFEG